MYFLTMLKAGLTEFLHMYMTKNLFQFYDTLHNCGSSYFKSNLTAAGRKIYDAENRVNCITVIKLYRGVNCEQRHQRAYQRGQ